MAYTFNATPSLIFKPIFAQCKTDCRLPDNYLEGGKSGQHRVPCHLTGGKPNIILGLQKVPQKIKLPHLNVFKEWKR